MSEHMEEESGAPQYDLSDVEEESFLPDVNLDDPSAVKQIRKRTSTGGKIVSLVLVASAVGVGFMAYQHHQAEVEVSARFDAIHELESEAERVTELRAMLEIVSDATQKERILKNLAHYGDAESLPAMIEGLSEAGEVRRGAAWAIAHLGSPTADSAKDAVFAVVSEEDDVAHNTVVWAAAVLGDERAADEIVESFAAGGLQDMEGFGQNGPRIIMEAVGIERLSSEALMQHDSEAVRVLTAHALSENATSDVVGPLGDLLRAELVRETIDRSTEVIRATTAGLGRTGDPRAAAPLFALLEREPGFQSLVTDALRKSVAGPGLVTLLGQAVREDNRTDLIRLLAQTHDPRVADTLAEQLEDGDAAIRMYAAAGLAELGDERAQPALLALARDEDYSDAALQALKLVATPSLSDGLRTLKEELPYSLAAILRIMGMTGDQSLASEITSELDGDDLRSASLAAATLNNDGAFRTLVGRVVRPRDIDMSATSAGERRITNERLLDERKAAIQAMGLFGRDDAADELMQVVEDVQDDYELRSLAGASLGLIANDEQVEEVLQKVLSSDLEDTARRYYMHGLWQRPRPALNNRLLAIMGDGDAPSVLRRSAALAVGYAGDASSDARLLELLENESSRREAAYAIVLGGSEAAAERLQALMAESASLRDVMQERIQNQENDHFNMLTTDMLESGQIWRRLRVAEILAEGDDDERFSYAWAKIVGVLGTGWGGLGGATALEVRNALWDGLSGDNEMRRRLAADVLGEMGEIGLLLRARDEGGSAGEAAAPVLHRITGG